MIVEFDDGAIKTYKINEQKSQFALFWQLQINPAAKIEGGKTVTAEEVTMKQEEEIIEEGQETNPDKEMQR